MIVGKIGSDYTVNIPDPFREAFEAGQEVAISTDAQGRLVITPVEHIRARLLETFGMWANRTGALADGIAYMDEIRQGQRLNKTGLSLDETD